MKSKVEGVFAVQADGAVISASPTLMNLVSETPHAWRGERFVAWLADAAQERVRRAWETYLQQGLPSQVETTLRNGVPAQLCFVEVNPPDEWAVVVRPAPDSLERRVAPLEALNAVWQALASTLDLPALLELIFHHLRAVLPFDSASILLREGDSVRMARAVGYPEDFPPELQRAPDRFPTFAYLFRERRPLVIPDTSQSELWVVIPQTAYIRSWIGVPLIVGDDVIGVLSVDSQTPGAYHDEDADLAFAFGQQAATAIHNARHYDQAVARAERLAALYQVGLAISRLDVDEILRLVYEQISALIDANTFYIALYDAESDVITFRLVYDCGEPLEPFTTPAAGTLVGWVIARRQSVMILDTERQEPPVPLSVRGTPMRSILMVPMSAGEQAVGVLSVQSHEPNAFTDEDALLVEAIASQTAVAIRNAQLFDETARRLAMLEGLQQTSLSLSVAPGPETALEHIAQTVINLSRPNSLCISLVDETGAPQKHLRTEMQSPPSSRQVDDVVDECSDNWPEGLLNTMAGAAARTSEPLLIGNTRAYPLLVDAGFDDLPHGAIAAFPMKRVDRVLGVFLVGYGQPRRFRDEEVRLLRLLADQAAMAVENALNYQETQNRLREMTALYDLAKQTISDLNLEAVLQMVVTTLRQLFEARGASIALLDKATNEVVIKSSVGIEEHWREVARLKVGEGVSGKVVETGVPMYVPDTYTDPTHIFFDRRVRSLLTVPLRVHDRIIGTLSLDSNQPNAFTERHERLLTIAASQVAVAIENAQLYEQLRDRAEKLEAAYAELKELNELRNEMVANVTHELRKPLTFLKGYIGLIRDGELGPVTQEQIEAMVIINEKTDFVARLISDILAMERITPDSLQLATHDLNEISACAVADAQVGLTVDNRQLAIRHEPAPGAIWVAVDRDRITQVIYNLLHNAIKFTPDGGTITVTTYPQSEGEGFARLSVSDTGIGILPDKLAHVFERFFQVKPFVGFEHSGTGLGLAIVQRIIAAHGGQVWAESEAGKGSTFSFTLPVVRDDDDAKR